MAYFDGDKSIGTIPDAFIRRWFKATNDVVVPFAVRLPAEYDSGVAYPMIVTSGGSYAVGFDNLGWQPGTSLYHLGGSAPVAYLYTRKTDCIYLAVQYPTNASVYPGIPVRDLWSDAVAELIAALDDDGDVTCYRYYGTALDNEVSLASKTISGADVLGDSQSLKAVLDESTINVDSNKIYYIGYSQGALDAWHVALSARDRIAAIMPIDAYFPLSVDTSFYADLLANIGGNKITHDYWCGSQYESYKNPVTGYDDGYEGTAKTGIYYNLYRSIGQYAMGWFMRRIKHIPIITYNGSAVGSAQQGIIAAKTLHAVLKAAEADWSDFVCVNRYRVSDSDPWLLLTHTSSSLFSQCFGEEVASRVACFDGMDIASPAGLTYLLEKGDNVTPLEWMLSKAKNTNPALAEDVPFEVQIDADIPEVRGEFIFSDTEFVTAGVGSDKLKFLNDSGELKTYHGAVLLGTLSEAGSATYSRFGQNHRVTVTQIADDVVTCNINSPLRYLI